MRTWAYIDGFNLYYGCLRTSPYKWLNLKQLCSDLLPPFYQLEKVKYFTARVSGSVDPGAPARQLQYLKALRTMPEVEILLGTFLPKVVRRPLVNLPIAGMRIHCDPPVSLPRGQHRIGINHEATLPVGTLNAKSARQATRDAVKVDVHWFEEKGSDVNLAVHLVNDAWSDRFEAALVLTNDSDLCEPIRIVNQERRRMVILTNPHINRAGSPKLEALAGSVRHLRASMLARAQLPDPIPGTEIRKPPAW